MNRRLLNLLTALSLLLCVAVCVLWVRSYGSRACPLLDISRPTALYRTGGRSMPTGGTATGSGSFDPKDFSG